MRDEKGRYIKGHNVTEEWRTKHSKLMKGKRMSKETEFKPGPRYNKRKITDGYLIRLFSEKKISIKEIARMTSLADSTIAKRLRMLGYKLVNKGKFGQGINKGNLKHGHYKEIKTYKILHKECEICKWDYSIDVHHIIPMSKGGSNEHNNLICLCPNHHRLTTIGLITIHKSEDGLVVDSSLIEKEVL